MFGNHLPYPTWSVGGIHGSGTTAFAALIPPYPGPINAPLIYALDPKGRPNWWGQTAAWTHVSRILFTTGTTLQTNYLMRPQNFTTAAGAAAAGQAVINLTEDPGIFSTNYRFPLPGAQPTAGTNPGRYAYPGRVADDGIAGGDYCAYQLTDGTWVLDTVSSVSALAITMTTNVPAGGVAAGAPFFLFGQSGDSDPATGNVHYFYDTTASTTNEKFDDPLCSFFQTLHPGDPVCAYFPNATATCKLSWMSGYYARH